MSLVAVLVLAAAVVWVYRRSQHRSGAGASAAARARQLRTPAVRLATLLGIRTRAERLARRYDAGAEGERRTARQINRPRQRRPPRHQPLGHGDPAGHEALGRPVPGLRRR